jgi:hypothetical protein
MRPTEPAGFREAWDIVERLWDGTVARTRGMEPALTSGKLGGGQPPPSTAPDESVDAEWSFIETCVMWRAHHSRRFWRCTATG